MKTFFLRCDDVKRPDPAFRRTAALFEELGLPLSCAVIPSAAGSGLAAFLRARAEAGLSVETLQHGLSHAEHSGNRYLKQEFGPARTYCEQRGDIAEGKGIMRRLFGNLFTPVFVPPFHFYNSDTVKAIGALKFRAISASRRPESLARGLLFLGTRVTVNEYGLDLKPKPLDLKILKSRTLAAIKEKGPAGIYFHHSDLGSSFRIFSDYAGFLKDLELRGLARFSLCRPLLKKPAR